jgi:hypothetical protein
VLGGTHLRGNFFGVGDQSFIFAVWPGHPTVMTLIGEAVVGLMTVAGAIHATNLIHQAEATWCFLEPLLQWRLAVSDGRECGIAFLGGLRSLW